MATIINRETLLRTIGAGEITQLDALADLLGAAIGGLIGEGKAITFGQHTTIAASDTVVTGLAKVDAVIAVLDDDPVAGAQSVTASIGNQSGAPAAGSVLIKTWKATDANTTTVIAATTFAKKVNWIAVGDAA